MSFCPGLNILVRELHAFTYTHTNTRNMKKWNTSSQAKGTESTICVYIVDSVPLACGYEWTSTSSITDSPV